MPSYPLLTAFLISTFALSSPGQDKAAVEYQRSKSGLGYRVLNPAASGSARPKADDAVKLHYTMKDKAGKLLDTTRRGLGPVTLEIAKLFPGWREGLLLMQVGARFELQIPSDLGPEAPRVETSGPITMDIELLEILPEPRFERPDPAKMQKSDGGFSFQILREGKGQKIREEENFKLHFAFWDEKGKLIDWTRKRGPMPGIVGKMKSPFLNRVLTLMRAGSVLLCEVPPQIGFAGQEFPGLPAQSRTIWKVELLKIIPPLPVPGFVQTPKEKIIRSASGLGYVQLEAGDEGAPSPKLGQVVEVHYAGWLESGKLFDASYLRGETSSFVLNPGGLIPGWIEGLQLMRIGSVYRFHIPSKLGYGVQGEPRAGIAKDAKLIFEIRLVNIRGTPTGKD